MRFCNLADSVQENEVNNREDDSYGIIRHGVMSSEMMRLVDSVESELDDELLEESDETYREAA